MKYQCDQDFTWLPMQRAQLQSFAQMVKFTPLKHYTLINVNQGKNCQAVKQLPPLATKASIDCINAAASLYDVMLRPG